MQQPKATKRDWIGLGVISLACLLYSMDLTVLHLAVPRLTLDLEPSSVQLLWIIDIYGFFVAGSLITAGTLGDRIGRRRLLLMGAGLFGAASILAAFSRSAEMLIATRALLGIAGATVAPSTLSLIRNMFAHPRQRTTAISIWIMSFSLGGAIGPLLGGIMLEHFWWGSVFLISVPVMLLILISGPILLPEFRDPNAGKPDLPSALLSLTAVLTMIYGLKRIAQDGLTIDAVAFIVAGIALGARFLRRQRRLSDPLIDLNLFRVPAFSASLVMYGGCVLNMFGGFLFLPQYLQFVLGLSPLRAGIWTLPWALGFIVGSLATPALARRVRPAHLMSLGLLLSAAGYFMLAGVSGSAEPLLQFSLATSIMSLGASPVFTLTNDIIIGSAPPERAGAASGISETCAEFGGALGIAFFGSIGVAVYRGVLGHALPTGLSVEATNAALSTLGGAFAISRQLPAQVGAALTVAANDAFVRGLMLCSAISGFGSIALAIFASVTFRGVGTAPRRTGEHQVQAIA